jgi:hypothetical protein
MIFSGSGKTSKDMPENPKKTFRKNNPYPVFKQRGYFSMQLPGKRMSTTFGSSVIAQKLVTFESKIFIRSGIW